MTTAKTRAQAPWKRDNPKADGEHQALTPQAKAAAKRRAQKAGRPYPNLVDNMHEAERTAGKKAPAKKTPAKRTKAAATKDPEGGLTAAGRAAFARQDGAHLKPGVTKPVAEMTPDEMRRKGSWAVRFYGRETLPPLKKANGEPTRFALSAQAWGEPVPKTEMQARKIAAKGERLLKRYAAAKAKAAKAKAAAKTASTKTAAQR